MGGWRNGLSEGSRLAVVLGAGLLLAPAAPAAAATGELEVDGTLVQIAVEAPEGGLQVETHVRVDDTVVQVPADLIVPGDTGDAVTLTIAGTAMPRADAIAEVATPEPTDSVEVIAVDPAPTTSAPLLAPGVVGQHSLVVLPVYWSSPDPAASTTTLRATAQAASAYWSEQSGGRIAMSVDVRNWQKVDDPGGCTDAALWGLWDSALRVNGVLEPSGSQHVVVYFPKLAACPWAGQATIGGGTVWVNGTTITDVMTHEVGHNLGLGHANSATCVSAGRRTPLVLPLSPACTPQEYGDAADVMGIGLPRTTGSLNTGMADYLGLAVVSRPTAGAVTTVDLAPLAEVGAVRSVAIPVYGGTVYIDFRPAVGRDTRISEWAGVQVHYRVIDPAFHYPTTYLLDMQPTTPEQFDNPSFPVGTTWTVPGTSLVVTVTAVGSTARVVVGPPGSLPAGTIERYVTRVYQDLFGRSPDPGGLATWTAALASGTPRVAVANAITGSTEYRSGLIRESYRRYLSREAEPAGLAYWLGAMAAGRTISDMEAGFLASDEYYLQSGSARAAWVRRLYASVLGRTPSAAEVSSWVGQVDLIGRYAVARGFLLSTEHLTTVVDAYYVDLLGRHIDPTGRATWVGAIQRGSRLEEIVGSIIASDEYYAKV